MSNNFKRESLYWLLVIVAAVSGHFFGVWCNKQIKYPVLVWIGFILSCAVLFHYTLKYLHKKYPRG